MSPLEIYLLASVGFDLAIELYITHQRRPAWAEHYRRHPADANDETQGVLQDWMTGRPRRGLGGEPRRGEEWEKGVGV